MASFKIETVKLGCNVDNYETKDETIEIKTFDTIKEARKSLRQSLKNGYDKIYNNYFNKELYTELQCNF